MNFSKLSIVIIILFSSCGVNNTVTETDWEPIYDSTHTLVFDTADTGLYIPISSSIMSVWQKPMTVNDCNIKINYQDGSITISPKDTSKVFYGDAYVVMFQWLSKRIDSLKQGVQNTALENIPKKGN